MLDPSLNAICERVDWAADSVGWKRLWKSWKPTEWGYYTKYIKINKLAPESYIHGYVELCGRGYKAVRVTAHEYRYTHGEDGKIVRIPIGGFETSEPLKNATGVTYDRIMELFSSVVGNNKMGAADHNASL